MIVGVGIFLALSMTAMPIFSELKQVYSLRGAALRVHSDMQQARMNAVMTNRRYRAQVTSAGMVYLQEYDYTTTSWKALPQGYTLPNDTPGLVVTGATEVIFLPNGTSTQTSTVTILNTVGMQKQIVVSPSGSIRTL